ncbi:DUF1178 family protein [Xylophilus rhododendri]|uniref:DUF1178 family protein n=1 Tax=Xylophilus rhododendri TaxID=2697032 RepID=A0A857JAZ1_9BURK|nr:DUF1178 family protein [Xylophilus rhododendri]QHJ01185.1 DUF1178 family protein [Xylophilus rhododendri]
MKVLDLQCGGRHNFEGWFGSEDEFRDQLGRGLVACPVCGDTQIAKMPSAPRLNLSGARAGIDEAKVADPAPATVAPAAPAPSPQEEQLRAALWRAARAAVASAEDVGTRFADEARRIHHGEAEERGIRGQATSREARELVEEGIAVLPVPDALKETLQ